MTRTIGENVDAVMAYLRATEPKRDREQEDTRRKIADLIRRVDDLEQRLMATDGRLDELE